MDVPAWFVCLLGGAALVRLRSLVAAHCVDSWSGKKALSGAVVGKHNQLDTSKVIHNND